MSRRILALAVAAALAGHALPAAAQGQVWSQELAKCLVKSSSPDDNIVLIKWIFAAVSLHPAVQPLVALTPEQRDDLNKGAAAVFHRLVVVDCRQQTSDAIRYEGQGAFERSFNVLGGAAMRNLMGDPNVAQGLASFGRLFADDEDMKALFKAAIAPQ
jgi:hypothetical protein